MKLNNSLSKRLQWIPSNLLCYVWYGWYPPERCVLKHDFSSGAPVAWMQSRTLWQFLKLFKACLEEQLWNTATYSLPNLCSFPIFIPTPLIYPNLSLPIFPFSPLLSISFSHVLWMLCLHSGLQRFKAWTETPTFDWCVSSFELNKLVFTHVLICVYVFRHVLVCMC